jgi:2-polyprenyl-3-methyl-5-hydroxy-6-metoxy-1,4-benzoquinol methylase
MKNKNSEFNQYYFGNSRQEIFPFLPENFKTIIDVGCGYGYFLQYVKGRKPHVESWGIEYVEDVAKTLEGKLDHLIIGSIEDNYENLPNAYFDVICFNDVLEHLLDPDRVLQAVKSKLSFDGVIVGSIPNVRYFKNLYNLLVRKDWKYEDSGILDRTHLKFFTQKSILRMFRESGYDVVSIQGIFELKDLKYKLFNCMTFGFFGDSLFERYVFVVKKSK